jgi:hypothetical protein
MEVSGGLYEPALAVVKELSMPIEQEAVWTQSQSVSRMEEKGLGQKMESTSPQPVHYTD